MLSRLLQKTDNQPPIPRCEAYEKIGISRIEGGKLAQVLGYGSHEPFTHEQFNGLRDACSRLKFWRECGLSFNRFCKSLEKELKDNG